MIKSCFVNVFLLSDTILQIKIDQQLLEYSSLSVVGGIFAPPLTDRCCLKQTNETLPASPLPPAGWLLCETEQRCRRDAERADSCMEANEFVSQASTGTICVSTELFLLEGLNE